MTLTLAEDYKHQTVLLDEAVEALDLTGERAAAVIVDGTFGRGGHSRKILQHLNSSGRLIAFDKDTQAIASAQQIIDPRFEIVHDSFATMAEALQERDVRQVDGILMDLGISSPQVDDASRGFSFRADGPLDMRMDTTRGISAAEWLATEDEQIIREVIKNYGEERFAFQIAKAIVARRAVQSISSTRQLAEIVANTVKTREKGKDPATRTFQAIRIFINKELEDLEIGLAGAYASLAPHGRMVVISFHSLEDRIVKQFFASKVTLPQPDRRLPIRSVDLPQPEMKLIKKIKPSDAEVTANPRARSAILRVAERLPVHILGGGK
ncbi:16S rRNA (cytosine(1402)-N(4))-methyltransferase RsmH [Undibacterium sp. RTI2.1]|uniref:16S rRNA (cytosine(1402)-N(4))-methyltransferase RsmH n=1 Tax=unclassified Undibacterium TaxID=2630295 RepID=UPI002AB44E13|nr:MULTISPECIES: 16S rRNA (cytosine(1402)-N(4))-methyltransferase RsmH [unclassified Undibacterium]MDY7540347.1 16S rRNA (cytosine(1402)-N(4))-methyltransferase RsmH [Undibacterium sp. 5I1]MEB0029955.1 16S rRNA (cytosine(1402)-N(4))-methyltransferase RsmH [Undibacterium sp. RTI2.1]MEB0117081.1 16S rRNA (cytosine(1402)-N(4))-methyltransferase RsmH [Undibacterium sp. RTI2.2]MEB0229979.1 16S rRNA (cytosine(1402)-N(4))-methyltransferase RsmH [Undibacterium sp. 10I3]MEB0257999.1 16S rRNA (cytosine(